jgi:hypothetical protein
VTLGVTRNSATGRPPHSEAEPALIAVNSSAARLASSDPCALAASATVWNMPIGQPTQSIRRRIITAIVAGHRRMISSTVMPGSSQSCSILVHSSEQTCHQFKGRSLFPRKEATIERARELKRWYNCQLADQRQRQFLDRGVYDLRTSATCSGRHHCDRTDRQRAFTDAHRCGPCSSAGHH